MESASTNHGSLGAPRTTGKLPPAISEHGKISHSISSNGIIPQMSNMKNIIVKHPPKPNTLTSKQPNSIARPTNTITLHTPPIPVPIKCHHPTCKMHQHFDALKQLATYPLQLLKSKVRRRFTPKLFVYPRPVFDHNYPIFDYNIDTNNFLTWFSSKSCVLNENVEPFVCVAIWQHLSTKTANP